MTRWLGSTILTIFLIQVLFYIIAALFRTDKVTDLAYWLTFVLLAIWWYIQSEQTTVHLVLAIIVILRWIRLVSYLFIRILKIKKDERFDNMRNSWIDFGKFWILQTISIWIIFLPAIFLFQSNWYSDINIWMILGWWVYLIWLILETLADQQKYKYKIKNPKHWTDRGLRKYSRHPNYLWEMLVWIWIFTLISPILLQWQWFSIISPLFIITLLLFVSWVPLLEKQYDKKYGKDKEYIKYKKSTNLLLPIPKF